MDTMRTGVFAAVLALALGGCFGLPLHTTDVDEVLPQKAATIVVGETDRVAMRQLLGEPLAASEYWQLDLFRLSGTDAAAGFVLLPYPVPFMVTHDEVSAWLLAEFDANGKVSAYQTGVSHSNTDPVMQYSGPGHERLEVGDTVFAVDGSKKPPYLLVSPARRDAYLNRQVSQEYCTLLAGCRFDGCRSRLALEQGRLALAVDRSRQPSPQAPPLSVPDEGLFVLAPALTPGEHLVELRETSSSSSRIRASTQFSCVAGEVSYLLLLDEGDEGTGQALTVSSAMPEPFRDQRLCIWRDGQWLVSQEP
jgi:hypothetical protein